MSRIADEDLSSVFEVAQQWKDECILNCRSMIWTDESIWTAQTLEKFKNFFIDMPDTTSGKSFEQKFEEQLARTDEDVTKLACELLLIYFLFPSGVSRKRKIELIQKVASWKGLSVDEANPAFRGFSASVGDPGLAYNTGRPNELTYLARIAIELVSREHAERTEMLTDHRQLREVLETLADRHREDFSRPPQLKHILLYLLYPDYYERIASEGHKGRIVGAFADIFEIEKPDHVDDCLKLIREQIEKNLPNEDLDFYWSPLRACWYVDSDATGDGIGELSALHIKKQIVLFGPPGTGKTYQARQLADRLIRQELLKVWKPARFFSRLAEVEKLIEARTHRVQFHPGYGYEDFIRGLQIADGGKTTYGSGVLLVLIDEIMKEPVELRAIPVVLILDEMNRADLSKVLGECFSLLEDRDTGVMLAGYGSESLTVRLPNNLYLIGTMNLIDQSLENIDFALRRRFLWFFKGFSLEDFFLVCRHRWIESQAARNGLKSWDRVEPEFTILAERAARVNKMIDANEHLGENYQIGHTYFCDAVAFAQTYLLSTDKRRNQVLFNGRGNAIDPIISLWRYSLRPLLVQYLSGIDALERKAFLAKIESLLLSGARV